VLGRVDRVAPAIDLLSEPRVVSVFQFLLLLPSLGLDGSCVIAYPRRAGAREQEEQDALDSSLFNDLAECPHLNSNQGPADYESAGQLTRIEVLDEHDLVPRLVVEKLVDLGVDEH
jgi:hypothetical protein